MASNPLGGRMPENVTRVSSGVAHVREHTIEIGSTVLWIDNIGSIYLLEAKRSWLFMIAGILAALAGLQMLQSNFMLGAGLLAIGGGLIYLNLNQKLDSGISIGTVDGRRTLIISKDREFTNRALNFIRDKIDSGSTSLQGSFDVTTHHFDSHGGGMMVTGGVATTMDGQPISRTPQPQPAYAYQGSGERSYQGSGGQPQLAVDDYVQQARSLYQRGAAEIAPRLSEFMKAQNWPERAPMQVAMLALALGVLAGEIGMLTNAYAQSTAAARTPTLTYVLIAFATLASAWFAVIPSRIAERGNRPFVLTLLLLLSAGLTAASGFVPPDYLLALVIGLVALKALAAPLANGLVGDAFADSNRAGGMGAVLGGASLAGFLIGASQSWATEKFGATFAPIVFAVLAAAVALVGMRFVSEGERESDVETPGFGAVWRRIGADRAASSMLAGLMLLAILSPAIVGQLYSRMFLVDGGATGVSEQRSMMWAIAAALGALGGGLASDYLGQNEIRMRGWVSAGCTIAGAVLAFFAGSLGAGLGNIVGAAAVALMAGAAPPAYGIVMYAAGQRGRTNAAALIQFLSAFTTLGLGSLLLVGAAALIGRTSHIEFGFGFPGVTSWDGDSSSSSWYGFLPIKLQVMFAPGAARSGLDMGALVVAALMAWPAWCFFRGGQALGEPQAEEQDEPIMRGGPPGALIGMLGLVALAGVVAFPVLAAGPDSRQTFAPSASASASPQILGALSAVSAQTPLSAAALDEAQPSLLDRLYRLLPQTPDPAWRDVPRAVVRFNCDASRACSFSLNTHVSDDPAANQFTPGGAFAGFDVQQTNQECVLSYKGKAVFSDFCASASGDVVIFAPAPQSGVSLIAHSNSQGGYSLAAFDARRGETLFYDSSVLANCAPTALDWSPAETRVLIGAGCGNGAAALVLVDLSRRIYARTSIPAQAILNYDFANSQGEQHFAGRWVFAPSQVRLRGRAMQADLAGRFDLLNIGMQTVANSLSSPDGARTWFQRLRPTMTASASLDAQGLEYAPSQAAPALAWAPPGADQAQAALDRQISASYGAQPASVTACPGAAMCWTVAYANGAPPSQQAEGAVLAPAGAGEASATPQQPAVQFPAVAGRWAGQATQDGRRATAVQVVISQKDNDIDGTWQQSVTLLGQVQTRFTGAISADGAVRLDRSGVDGLVTTYVGRLSGDGTTISGRWQRGAVAGTFELQRN